MTVAWFLGVAMISYYTDVIGPGVYIIVAIVGITLAVWYFMDYLELTLKLVTDKTKIQHA
jgi:uncharacterized membrane protein YwaF